MKLKSCVLLVLAGGLLLTISSCSSEEPVPRRIVYQDTGPAAAGAQGAFAPFGVPFGERLLPPEATIEQSAIRALASIGAPSVPSLAEMLGDSDPTLRREAARGLARIGDEARAAVPQLTVALQDTDPEVRRYATRALGAIGPAAKAAVPALIQELRQTVKQSEAAAAAAQRQAAEQKNITGEAAKLPTDTSFPSKTVPTGH